MTFDTCNLIAKILLVLMYMAAVTFLAYMAACFQSWRLSRTYRRKPNPDKGKATPNVLKKERKVVSIIQGQHKKADSTPDILHKNSEVDIYAN